MGKKRITLAVTGANGHTGLHVIRLLLKEDRYHTIGVVRSKEAAETLRKAGCRDIRFADMTDEKALYEAVRGADIVLHLAAVYKHWSENPQKEIVQPNIRGAEHILSAAEKAGVHRIVFVSSLTTVNRKNMLQKGVLSATGWNESAETGGDNPYVLSKVKAEQFLLQEGKKRGIEVISLLPSTITGGYAERTQKSTLSMQLFKKILLQGLPLDPELSLYVVSVHDVAQMLVSATERGEGGKRYILSCEKPLTTGEITALARKMKPLKGSSGIRLPSFLLYGLAYVTEWWGSLSGKEPLLLRSQLDLYHKKGSVPVDITPAREDLGFSPASPEEVVQNCFTELLQQEE